MNYDKWKLETPEEPENECYYCGNICDNDYCSSDCKKADYIENCIV